jgi:RNA polymerase sigma-70 factor (ECF subfamily)
VETERQLLELARGDKSAEAFAALVKVHQGSLRAFLVRLCKDYDLADDIAQDSFIIAYRKLDSLSSGGSFGAWLFKIAYNNFLQHLRRLQRRDDVVGDYQQYFELQQERYDGISTAQFDLEKAMVKLGSGEIAAITLCHSFGFSHSEAADILKIPLGTVKTHINRGKARLRELLVAPALEKAS